MSLFGTSLMITAIGMGLVFVAILLLWGLMDLIMRWTQDKKTAESPEEAVNADGHLAGSPYSGFGAKGAAVAAVAVAFALRQRMTDTAGPLGSGAARSTGASTWQAIGRTAQMNQSSLVSRRR